MGITNLAKVLFVLVLLAYFLMDATGIKIPFVIAGLVAGLLMVLTPFSAKAEALLLDTSRPNRSVRRLATFAFGAVLLFGVWGFSVIAVHPV